MRGYSLIELLAVIAIIGLLASLAMANYQSFTAKAYDATAESDYRNVKTAMFNAIADPNAPDRFVFSNRQGPNTFPYPLNGATLSDSVVATVFHQTRRRTNGRPITNTRIDVFHLEGGKQFRYREVNGVVTEQILDR